MDVNYLESFCYVFSPPYSPRTILEITTFILGLIFLPDITVLTFIIALYASLHPFVAKPRQQPALPQSVNVVNDVNALPQKQASTALFSIEATRKSELLLLVLMWTLMMGNTLFEQDVSYTNDEPRLINGNGSYLYITFTDAYPRCVFEKMYVLDISTGCGSPSPNDEVMRVFRPNDPDDCTFIPKLKCNGIEFSGKPLCSYKEFRGVVPCVDAIASSRVQQNAEHHPGRHLSVLPTSSNRIVAILMDQSRALLRMVGGPTIKGIVDEMSPHLFPLTYVIDLFLVSFGLFICRRMREPSQEDVIAGLKGTKD